MSAPERDAHRLDHAAARCAAPTSAQKAGPSSPCSWTWVRPSASAACGDLVERRVDEHADELDPAAQRRGDPGRDGRIGGARGTRARG